MRFDAPWAFLLLLLLPALWYARRRLRGTTALRFSSTRHAARAGQSLRRRLAFVPDALRGLALVLLVFALARPQQGLEQVRDVSKGIAIEMVLDRSGSMAAEMNIDGESLNRLEVAKRVFREFVLGNGKGLEGRSNDLIGMIDFARFADTICPLTLGHGALDRFLDTVHLVQRRNEDGTAIGDALALASARLKTAEETLAKQVREGNREYDIKSKIIILLTDGQHNIGQRSPAEAAALAKEWGIKIYTVGIGGGESATRIQTPFGEYLVPTGSDLDERTLQGLADATGGVYRRASDAKSLREIYEEIDRLERSEIESLRYVDYREWFTPFAIGALLALLLEVALSATVFRKIP